MLGVITQFTNPIQCGICRYELWVLHLHVIYGSLDWVLQWNGYSNFNLTPMPYGGCHKQGISSCWVDFGVGIMVWATLISGSSCTATRKKKIVTEMVILKKSHGNIGRQILMHVDLYIHSDVQINLNFLFRWIEIFRIVCFTCLGFILSESLFDYLII